MGAHSKNVSKEELVRINRDYTVRSAQIAKEQGCKQFTVITSKGSSKNSVLHALTVKAELKEKLEEIHFDRLSIFRPGNKNSGMSGIYKAALENVMVRPLMSFQPARIIMIDMAYPFEVQGGRLLCDTLENTLCISANMAGPSRIPLIGIYVLASYPENVLPLTCTKGNFVRLHAALTDIRTFLDESLQQHQSREVAPCIAQGMLEACKQYKRYIQNITQAAVVFKQVELIVVTGQRGDVVQKHAETLADQLDLSIIKRIVSVTLDCNSLTTDTQDSPDVPTFDAVSDEISGLVDIITLECDPMSHQKFFYSWLLDTSSECEQIRLQLPPPNQTEPELMIKCDFAERMISPTQLPFSDAYNLHVESNSCKYVFPTLSKSIGMTVPIQQLQVVRCLPREALCESVLFGLPLILLPTACWKIDWEELEQNQQNFASLCHALFTKDQVLLAQLMVTSPKTADKSTTCGWSSLRLNTAAVSSVAKPAGYFVLMASGHSTKSLLIKSVLTKELLLPSTQTVSSVIPTEKSVLRVQASLSQVSTGDSFNPLSYDSALFAALKYCSLPKSLVDKARTLKRKIGLPRT